MKWHYPLMEYALEQGTLLQHKLFVPAGHGIEVQWTFAASFLYPAAQDQKSAPLDRAHVAGEKRRWELTLSHWDTNFVELDKTESPLSVYLPSAGGCKS
jgi:hypothetical protein